MHRVIVIGADGFLGRNLSIRLAEEGKNVMALVFLGANYASLKDFANITCKEFTFDTLHSIDASGYDTIYHMAWTGVNSALKNDALVQIENISYGLKVLQYAESQGIKRIIVPGSAAEVSCGLGIITGKEKPAPSDMYSASKVATRYVCQTYARQHNLELIWTLITSIYGPGRNDNNIITYAIKALLKGEKPSFSGLQQQWDYLYIDDLLSALVALGESGIGGKIYPVGSGEHHQMADYIEKIRNQINPEAELGIGDLPYKNRIIDNQILDISDLKHDTGFVPLFDFDKGIKQTIEYFKTLNNVGIFGIV